MLHMTMINLKVPYVFQNIPKANLSKRSKRRKIPNNFKKHLSTLTPMSKRNLKQSKPKQREHFSHTKETKLKEIKKAKNPKTQTKNMYRFSNTLIGYLNLLSLLASIPIIGGALWFARSSATCESTLQTPLLILGFVILLVSLAGFVGGCFNVACALWFYLFVMLLLIAALLCVTVFGFAVTGGGGGTQVAGRVYKEYKLEDYSGWLRKRISEDRYWRAARSCVVGSKACAQIAAWTPLDYLQRDLTPIQSGCCKPPTSCTYGTTMPMTTTQDEDCYRWNNDATILCYGCDSCKAGVLEQVRMDWHKLSILNVVVLIFLIGIYSIGCCAFRNAQRYESDYPYGRNHMSKVNPRWDYYWWRWWRDRRDQLY